MNSLNPTGEQSLRAEVTPLGSIDATEWDALIPAHNPFLRHAFLHALEESGAVGEDTGWCPQFISLFRGDEWVGALPLYQKSHSFGEYVFDWQWADAWERAGGHYYPKLIGAVPFTPSSGPRLLLKTSVNQTSAVAALEESLTSLAGSGFHLLFPTEQEASGWRKGWPELMLRTGMQYHWFNRGYTSFDDFLARFTSKRRKEVRRERRKVAEQGIALRRLRGSRLGSEELHHFYQCYQITYLEHGMQAYLPYAFFEQLVRTMPEQLTLVQACVEERPVACALFFHDDHCLYGRYWGSEVMADSLHFETCYYQGIELALELGLERFDPGTQGEHKIPRGFEPVTTHSLHFIKPAALAAAVDRFLAEERTVMALRQQDAASLLPFKQQDEPH